MNITNSQQIFDRQRESEKFKALSPQQRLDYLRSRHGQIELDVISYQDSEGLGLISSWLVKDGRCCPLDGSLTDFPHYTVAVLDEQPLPEKIP